MTKKRVAFICIAILLCLLVYLPTPKKIDLEEFHPGAVTHLHGLNISTDVLDSASLITTPYAGAQDIEIDSQGYIYSGLHDGRIIRVDPNNLSDIEEVAKTQGVIFGIDINSKETHIALADQSLGIRILDLKTRQFETIVAEYQGSKFASPNAVVFGRNDEELFFTVSSEQIHMTEFHEMMLYGQSSGRIFSYSMSNKTVELLADDLYFVNGLEYSSKDNCLYFVETSRSRLWKLELEGARRGQKTLLLDNILGYPDNVKESQSGDLWVAIPALRDDFSNIIEQNAILRKVILNLRVPLSVFMMLSNMQYAGGIKVSKTGQIVEYFFGDSSKIDCVSGINQKNGRVYLSSLSRNKIAVVSRQAKPSLEKTEETAILRVAVAQEKVIEVDNVTKQNKQVAKEQQQAQNKTVQVITENVSKSTKQSPKQQQNTAGPAETQNVTKQEPKPNQVNNQSGVKQSKQTQKTQQPKIQQPKNQMKPKAQPNSTPHQSTTSNSQARQNSNHATNSRSNSNVKPSQRSQPQQRQQKLPSPNQQRQKKWSNQQPSNQRSKQQKQSHGASQYNEL